MAPQPASLHTANPDTTREGGRIALYGTDTMGTRFLQSIQTHRPDVQCAFFIDSFTREPDASPPVLHVGDRANRLHEIETVSINSKYEAV